jgi:hypothetical protein
MLAGSVNAVMLVPAVEIAPLNCAMPAISAALAFRVEN